MLVINVDFIAETMSFIVSRNSCESSVHHILADWNVIRDLIGMNNAPRITLDITALIGDEVRIVQVDIAIKEENRFVFSLHDDTNIIPKQLFQEQGEVEKEKKLPRERVRLVGMIDWEGGKSSHFIDVAEIGSGKSVVVRCDFPEEVDVVKVSLDLTLFFGHAAFQ